MLVPQSVPLRRDRATPQVKARWAYLTSTTILQSLVLHGYRAVHWTQAVTAHRDCRMAAHFGLSTFNAGFIHYGVPISGYITTIVLAYLLGSIPTGFLVGKARGIDIRTMGSGNIGATNVFRYFGTVAGVLVLAVDALKGFIAVALLTRLVWHALGKSGTANEREALEIVAGLAAILGHNFTCWLRFKGGKGIATSAGVLVALVPYALLDHPGGLDCRPGANAVCISGLDLCLIHTSIRDLGHRRQCHHDYHHRRHDDIGHL